METKPPADEPGLWPPNRRWAYALLCIAAGTVMTALGAPNLWVWSGILIYAAATYHWWDEVHRTRSSRATFYVVSGALAALAVLVTVLSKTTEVTRTREMFSDRQTIWLGPDRSGQPHDDAINLDDHARLMASLPPQTMGKLKLSVVSKSLFVETPMPGFEDFKVDMFSAHYDFDFNGIRQHDIEIDGRTFRVRMESTAAYDVEPPPRVAFEYQFSVVEL